MPLVSATLPTHSAVYEKLHYNSQRSWTKQVVVPIPGVSNRGLCVIVPNLPSWRQLQAKLPKPMGRKRTLLLICFACMAMVMTVMLFSRNVGTPEWPESWPPGDPPTLVFRREDLQRIWKWEVASGHYPSRHSSKSNFRQFMFVRVNGIIVPRMIGLSSPPFNPAIPAKQRNLPPSCYRPPPSVVTTSTDTDTLGVGPKRVYLDIQSLPPHVAYPHVPYLAASLTWMLS